MIKIFFKALLFGLIFTLSLGILIYRMVDDGKQHKLELEEVHCSITSYSPKYAPIQRGVSSRYGPRFHRRTTANGEKSDMDAMTAANRKHPFGSWIRVTNLKNGKKVLLRVNDRGPYPRTPGDLYFTDSRVLDVSRAGARALGFEEDGKVGVLIELEVE